MKALKGTQEEKALTQRYTNELDDQETQLASMRKEISSLEAKRNQAQQELDATIAHLSFDTTM
jgi:predicted ribosome quality control (RQC) complex YloA/Tae2 family protein